MSVGKTVRLFLVDGTPGGLLTAEIMNWTGKIIAAPRSDLRTLLKRPETSRTGIYIITGDDPDSLGGLLAYIGEGDDVSTRLVGHSRSEDKGGKDFWDRAIVLTSKDTNLTKAHARYLESRFIELAQHAGRAKLTNSTSPTPVSLPEADVSDMEYFINQVKIVLPVLGVNIFRSLDTVGGYSSYLIDMSVASPTSPIFELRVRKEGLVARAQEVDGEFTVLEGSQARRTWVGVDHGYQKLREKLEKDGTILASLDGQAKHFARNQVFASPSAAAAVVLGTSANGRELWKIPDNGGSYGSWQNQGVESVAPGLV